MKKEKIVGYRGSEFTDSGFIYVPYVPVVNQVSHPIKKGQHGVIFIPYEKLDDETPFEGHMGAIFSHKVCGIEQHDGTVLVFKNNKLLKRPVRNKEIFEKKYFTEAI